MAVLPADKPRYLVTILLDEPQAVPGTYGFATSGWNAAPTAAKIIARVAPMLGLEPRLDLPPAGELILANMKQAAR
jgi:cell division protein FtsI (penicillin-binding protein 3)